MRDIELHVIELRARRGNVKRCGRCGAIKDYSEFHYNKQQSDRAHVYCKDCRHKEKLEWNNQHRDLIAQYNANYQAKKKKLAEEAIEAKRKENDGVKKLIESKTKKTTKKAKNKK